MLSCKGIEEYFDKIFCLPQMDVKKDFFYRNIKQFIPTANKVVVFEDDIKVLKFLNDLGYQTIAIKNTMNSEIIGNNFKDVIVAD